MAALRPATLLGIGAVTPVGASAPVAMAAAQAGVARIALEPEDAGDDDPDVNHVARIATLAENDPAARGRALLGLAVDQAVDQAMAELPRAAFGPMRVFVVGPVLADGGADAAAVVGRVFKERGLALPLGVEHVGSHGAAGLLAVERALLALHGGAIELALVAGFDTRTDAASLEAALKAGRILGPSRPWGYVPGEAGAALVLSSAAPVRQSEARVRTALLAVASAHEPHPLGSAWPCVGRGLTEAVRQVLDRLPADTNVSGVYCDLNGERHRSDEWGFTVARVGRRLEDPGAFVAPASAWGDCGAVNGLLLLALAAAAGAREASPGAHGLVWTCADGPARAAALLSLPTQPAPQSTASAARSSAAPLWATVLDLDILTEMVDECGFRYGQRAYQIEQASSDEPLSDGRPIERTEEILDALALGLAEAGEPACTCAAAATEAGACEATYTAVRVFLEAGRCEAAMALATRQITEAPATEGAVLDAYLHTLRAPEAEPDRVKALLAGDSALWWLGLQVAASAEHPLPDRFLAALAQAVPPARALTWLRALGRLGDASARSYIARYYGSPDPVLRREAGVADVLLGGEDARRELLARAETDPALLLPAALVLDPPQASWLLSQAVAAADADAVLAVALAGDAGAVPWLLEQLGQPTTARVATAALTIVLGVACFEDGEAPDLDETAPPRKVRRLSLERSTWEPLAARVLAASPRAARLRGGVPASAAATIVLLERPHLPLLVRRLLGHELAARWGASRAFSPTAPVRLQRRWLAAARQRCENAT